MADKDIIIGEIKGELKGVIKATQENTAQLKIFNEYMFKSIGAQEESDKQYKRVKHTAIGSAIVSLVTLVKGYLS